MIWPRAGRPCPFHFRPGDHGHLGQVEPFAGTVMGQPFAALELVVGVVELDCTVVGRCGQRPFDIRGERDAAAVEGEVGGRVDAAGVSHGPLDSPSRQ